MQKWEYFVTNGDLGTLTVDGEECGRGIEPLSLCKYFDEMGDMGWELVSVTRAATGSNVVLIFKRPKNKF